MTAYVRPSLAHMIQASQTSPSPKCWRDEELNRKLSAFPKVGVDYVPREWGGLQSSIELANIIRLRGEE